MPKQLISYDQATPCSKQITKPCSDCPWARKALAGWLGSDSIETWLQTTHGEYSVDCHTRIGVQCAGLAIYRANTAKLPRDKSILVLPIDRKLVFATPDEFREHHQGEPLI